MSSVQSTSYLSCGRSGSTPEPEPRASDVQALSLPAFEPRFSKPGALEGEIEQTFGHFLVRSFQIPHQMTGEFFVLVGNEGVGSSLLTGTTCPTYPVGVGVYVASHVVVKDSFYVRNVQTTS